MCSFLNSQKGPKSITVLFLDGKQQNFDIEGSSKGGALLELVFQYLQLSDTEYFGLQYTKNREKYTPDKNPEQLIWLDTNKTIPKKVGTNRNPFLFGIKIFVPDPTRFKNKHAIRQYFLQVAKDMAQGKLQLPPSSACLLASYVVQAKVGDYQSSQHGSNYISDLHLLPELTKSMEDDIEDLHKQHRGQLSSEAELKFLENARHSDMYGVRTFPVKNSENKVQRIGVAFEGVIIYENQIKKDVYHWNKIQSLVYFDKKFHVTISVEPKSSRVVKFEMESTAVAAAVLRTSMIVHTFHMKYVPTTSRGT